MMQKRMFTSAGETDQQIYEPTRRQRSNRMRQAHALQFARSSQMHEQEDRRVTSMGQEDVL
jgi:hypothetical protein